MPPSQSASHALPSPQNWAFKETQEDLAGFGEGAQAGGEGSSNLKVLLAVKVLSMSRSNLALCYLTLLYLARNFGPSLPYNSQLHYQWAQVKIWVQLTIPSCRAVFGPKIWFRFITERSHARMKPRRDAVSSTMDVQGSSQGGIFYSAHVRKRESLKNDVNVIPSNCKLYKIGLVICFFGKTCLFFLCQ